MSFKNIFAKAIFIFIFSLLSIDYANATHIIGGELTYTCLGNNKYEISLTVYRDCYNGRPPFDNPAYIGVYGSDKKLILIDSIVRGTVFQLDPKLSDTCLVVPPEVCVETTIYKDTIDLPPRIGGYTLAYQRCCRNVTIKNIIDPLDSGATFMIEITEAALNSCNSSAKFKEWPPIYICVNKPINFDQSAIDINGDSVFYRLCTPLLGGSDSMPQPRPAFPPPYEEVKWKTPYGLQNILGGEALTIDPKTGILTGTPNAIGQFVVGICLEEFRQGKIISTTRRDFQFNVGVCGNSVASIFAPKIVCDDFTVFFDNESLNSNKYEWDFGDKSTVLDTSFAFSPAYVYSDTGTYTIRLITQPRSACADTSFHTLTIKNSSLNPNFISEEKFCVDSLVIGFTDTSKDTLGKKIVKHEWILANGTDTLRSNQKNPTFALKKDGLWEVTMIVTSENGCPKRITKNVVANLIDIKLQDTIFACQGNIVELNPNGNSTFTYEWSPTADFQNPKAPKQQVTYEKDKDFMVKISNGTCISNQKIYLRNDKNAPKVSIKVLEDTIKYGQTTQLEATDYPTTYRYTWDTNPSLSNTKISNPFVSPTVTTTYKVKVKAPNSTCEGAAEARVVVIVPVCAAPNVYIPTAFTPNDDGINDKLRVRGIGIDRMRFIVYDRWGEKVYESEDPTGEWDGYFSGKTCPPDVYAYFLEVICIDGKSYIQKGNVTLIR